MFILFVLLCLTPCLFCLTASLTLHNLFPATRTCWSLSPSILCAFLLYWQPAILLFYTIWLLSPSLLPAGRPKFPILFRLCLLLCCQAMLLHPLYYLVSVYFSAASRQSLGSFSLVFYLLLCCFQLRSCTIRFHLLLYCRTSLHSLCFLYCQSVYRDIPSSPILFCFCLLLCCQPAVSSFFLSHFLFASLFSVCYHRNSFFLCLSPLFTGWREWSYP